MAHEANQRIVGALRRPGHGAVNLCLMSRLDAQHHPIDGVAWLARAIEARVLDARGFDLFGGVGCVRAARLQHTPQAIVDADMKPIRSHLSAHGPDNGRNDALRREGGCFKQDIALLQVADVQAGTRTDARGATGSLRLRSGGGGQAPIGPRRAPGEAMSLAPRNSYFAMRPQSQASDRARSPAGRSCTRLQTHVWAPIPGVEGERIEQIEDERGQTGWRQDTPNTRSRYHRAWPGHVSFPTPPDSPGCDG